VIELSTAQSDVGQDHIVERILTGIETMTDEEREALVNKLDGPHKEEVNAAIRQWAAASVGSEDWEHL
jgi:recombinational DNA repair ATPase RecF